MKSKRVTLKYNPEVDAAYLKLSTGKVVNSEEVEPGLIVDFGSDDRVVGVEILRFGQRFNPKPARGRSPKRQAARAT